MTRKFTFFLLLFIPFWVQAQNIHRAFFVHEGQQAILAQTKKALPEKYAAAKKENAGNGSAYPEGFSIDVEVVGPIVLPLKLLINLTSDPKGIAPRPLESHLEGSLDAQGNFTFKNFGLGASPGHSF